MLEIDYPADTEQHFGVSIVEPAPTVLSAGSTATPACMSKVSDAAKQSKNKPSAWCFWPRTQAPLLVVTNMHPNAAAHFGQFASSNEAATN